jgi:hypothetical protein
VPLWIDPPAFAGTPANAFWSSSIVVGSNPRRAWVVNFADGTTDNAVAAGVTEDKRYVRCVTFQPQ